MAFFGILILAIFAIWFLIILAGIILFVFIPHVVLSIVFLVKSIQNNWKKPFSIIFYISITIVAIFVTLLTLYFMWRFGPNFQPIPAQ